MSTKTQFMILPTAPLKEGVLFPGMETKMIFTREASRLALQASKGSDNLIFLVSQKKADQEEPKVKDLNKVGIIAKVGRVEQLGENQAAEISSLYRAQVIDWPESTKIMIAHVAVLDDEYDDDEESLELLRERLLKVFARLLQMGTIDQTGDLLSFLRSLTPGQTCDHIANLLSGKGVSKQKILETVNVRERLMLTLKQVETEIKIARLETDIIKKTNEKFEKGMRENILRERLQMIQEELGDVEDGKEAADGYAAKLKKLETTPENKAKIEKELRRYRQTSSMSPESSYLRNWLDEVFELPWGKMSKDVLDLEKAEKILNETHYGLQEVKDRVLEYIAVLKMRGLQKQSAKVPTILCFVGPPGVGKTSIGQSIAKALGRKFAKISLGGVHDEAEIRGHRRTYVGAMAGRIINGLKQAGTSNPVFMLDEIDKMDNDYRGDPSSALLEVLDPAQNQNFEDHYLDMPYDLSQVIFIATANTTDIPEPLLDRMEMIRYAGYTTEEKMVIAKKYLLPQAMSNAGLKKTQVNVSDKILLRIIENYTKEAGVRELSRQLDKIMRKVDRKLLSDKKLKKLVVTEAILTDFLGPQMYDVTAQNQKSEVGVATGLAWTSVGGDVLFVEVATSPGDGNLKLTGQLGDVMKESAQAAMTFVRSHAKQLGLEVKQLDKTNVHIHVPEGAVPKDGPSAGVTLVTALVSALSGRPVKKDVAMTGEVTLRGKVLRIGGLKEKSIAAARSGCKIVCIPEDNQRDLVDIPKEIKKQIKFVPTKSVLENLEIALEKPKKTKSTLSKKSTVSKKSKKA